MEQEAYKGYVLWGHAILQQDVSSASTRYVASGTVMQERRLAEASGVLGAFDDELSAQEAGLAWARAWVDSHA